MDTSDLLKIRPITAYPTTEEKPVIVLAFFTTLQCHTHKKKKAVVENFGFNVDKFSPHYQTNKMIALAVMANVKKKKNTV